MLATFGFLALGALFLGVPPDDLVDEGASVPASSTDERHREQVTVQASADGTTTAPLGTSATVLHPQESVGNAATLTDVVLEIPAVSENGQGGLFQVVSIRGVSRQRVMNLLSGMRIVGSRRAGTSMSFVDPGLMGAVEVVRGPATTYHGSGALGGVLQVFPRSFDDWGVETGYQTNGSENYQLVGTGGEGWSMGLARRAAANAHAPDGTTLNTHFEQYSAVADWSWKRGPIDYELTWIPTYASDIGKANTDFPERTTNYPRERHQLLKFSAGSDRGWNVRGWTHYQNLETEVVETGVSQSNVSNDSIDFGATGERRVEVGSFDVRYGIDSFNRRNVNAEETDEDLQTGQIGRASTLNDASSDELGALASVQAPWGPLTWELGTRLSWIRQQNEGAAAESTSALNGFAGFSWSFAEAFRLKGGINSGSRFPTLGERFFTGTTGRGQVIGNPRLDPERALNVELGLEWATRHWFVGGAIFRNRIDEYIERIEIAPNVLTFVNLTSGTIAGAELQCRYRWESGWSILGAGHWIDGRAAGDEPLADIPPNELDFAGSYSGRRWQFDGRVSYRAAKDDPANGEKPIPAAWLLGAGIGYRIVPSVNLRLSGQNLLDEEYFRSADRKAPLAPARALAFQLIWTSN